jgi:hypothetical protein
MATKNEYKGVVRDPRSKAEKAKDWQATEIASASETKPTFRTVKKGKWKKYTVRDQNGSGSCVAQSLAKSFEVIRKINKGDTVVFSATPIYQKRSNKPNEGMYPAEAYNIAIKTGTCREKDCKSQLMTNAQMDAAVLPKNFEDLNNEAVAVASVVAPLDFDYVAGLVEKWGQCNLHIHADRKSWARDYPKLGSLNRGISHFITAVDAVTFEGVQYLVIEDSWGEFGEFKGQRLLSREVFKDMVVYAGALTVFKFDVTDVMKFDEFKTVVEFGQRSDEVMRIQAFLRDKGFFPSNQECTGYYGAITALAVYNFQIRYAVASPIELNQLKGNRVGAKTLAAMNKMR